jgi:hypothetical protein
MKIDRIIAILLLMWGASSCENEPRVFPDYPYSTVYFPQQTPVRTLVLGDYEVGDNTNDNNLKFIVSAHIGGMYENKDNQQVHFELVPELAQNLKSGSDTLELLPQEYYSLNPTDEFTIPKGKFYGGFEVQLNDAFLNDTMAYRTHYVLPARIVDSSLDSVLSGNTFDPDPDPRIAGEWVTPPRNYTLFGIKFINPYHGKYLHRGQSVVKDNTGTILETIIYHQKYVEQDEIWGLTTTGRNKVVVNGTVRRTPSSPGTFGMELTFDEDNNCTIKETSDSAFPVTGSGKFVEDADKWGNKPRNAIHLQYEITVGTETHFVTDTLVIRDRDVRFETFVPEVY